MARALPLSSPTLFTNRQPPKTLNLDTQNTTAGHVHKMFDEMPHRDQSLQPLQLFLKMQPSSLGPNEITLAKAIQSCGELELIEEGEQLHGHAIVTGLSTSTLVSNSLITMYSKNSSVQLATRVFDFMGVRSLVSWNSIITCCLLHGFVHHARELLDGMSMDGVEPDLVTWNCLISGYSRNGHFDDALRIFRGMQVEGMKPNSSSVASVLQVVVESRLIGYGKEIHGYVVRHGLESDVYVGTSLVDMYVKCQSLTSARNTLYMMNDRSVFTWNSLISGYAYNGLLHEAVELLKKMEAEGVQPDLTTWNGLIYGYSMKGMSQEALVLIDQLKGLGIEPNVVSWTALISGCCHNGNYRDSLHFLAKMQKRGVDPNAATIATLLRACTGLSLLKKGAELHCYTMRKALKGDQYVATKLIDMYWKCGSLQSAHHTFKKMKSKNLAAWNAMIMGFAAYGQGKEAILLFDEMCKSGTQPDGITLTALLSACRYSGLISQGWEYFDDMRNKYKITPTLEHYTCMVDLLARGGYLDEAWDFIQSMAVEPDAGVWGALLGACRTHRNLKLAEIAAKYLFELEPYNSANYLLIMSLYAYENRWDEVKKMKDAMKAIGVKSMAGWTWIQVDQTVHLFDVEGKSHPDIGKIFFGLYQLVSEIRKVGYVPDTGSVTLKTGEEDEEKLLMGHSEKLAMVYGLIKSAPSMPLRLVKKTRMCNDCHTMAKYISKLKGRVIILKEGNRFHHFRNGSCSCNDYW